MRFVTGLLASSFFTASPMSAFGQAHVAEPAVASRLPPQSPSEPASALPNGPHALSRALRWRSLTPRSDLVACSRRLRTWRDGTRTSTAGVSGARIYWRRCSRRGSSTAARILNMPRPWKSFSTEACGRSTTTAVMPDSDPRFCAFRKPTSPSLPCATPVTPWGLRAVSEILLNLRMQLVPSKSEPTEVKIDPTGLILVSAQ
jgi:hypothetical protein